REHPSTVGLLDLLPRHRREVADVELRGPKSLAIVERDRRRQRWPDERHAKDDSTRRAAGNFKLRERVEVQVFGHPLDARRIVFARWIPESDEHRASVLEPHEIRAL